MEIQKLQKKIHDRANFDCGVESLNNYLKTISSQKQERDLASTFVLTTEQNPKKIKGYYSLAVCTVALTHLPPSIARKFKDEIPCVLISKLAVGSQYQRQGFGSLLLVDAIRKAVASTKLVPVPMIIIDAKTEAAKSLYVGHGFHVFPQQKDRLFMPMRDARALIDLVDQE